MAPQHPGGGETLLRANEVAKRIGVHVATLYRFIERGDFPRGQRVTPRYTVWASSVVDAWIAETLETAPVAD
jgi:predicted DNA-binding transcriptional regulator AlpA